MEQKCTMTARQNNFAKYYMYSADLRTAISMSQIIYKICLVTFVKSLFLHEIKVFIKNRYSMITYYSLLSYVLVTLNNVVNVNYFPRHKL